MKVAHTIRRLRQSGWPRFAIVHLLRSNHPAYHPSWIVRMVVHEHNAATRRAREALGR